MVRQAKFFMAKHGAKVRMVFAVGTKIADHLKVGDGVVVKPYTHIYKRLDFNQADVIGQCVLDAFLNGDLTDVYVLYNRYVSAMRHEFTNVRLLPLDMKECPAGVKKNVEIEPVEDGLVLQQLLPLWLKSTLYHAIRSSYAAELVARMRAMDNATRNAATLIEDLTLEMNKVRQAVITRELVEITGTSEVMKE
jgi:F-type H+-transporting ATPase subunit gamma